MTGLAELHRIERRTEIHASRTEFASDVLLEILDLLDLGIFVTGGYGCVVYANRLGREMVRAGEVVQINCGRLKPCARDSAAALENTMTAARDSRLTRSDHVETVALRDLAGATRAAAWVLPLRDSPQPLNCHRDARFIVMIRPIGLPKTAPDGFFTKFYGVTAAEMRLLAKLAHGKTMAEASEELNISKNTAKTHLQRLFSKTDTKRQSELVRLAAAASPPVCADPQQPFKPEHERWPVQVRPSPRY